VINCFFCWETKSRELETLTEKLKEVKCGVAYKGAHGGMYMALAKLKGFFLLGKKGLGC
jgi:hypothetical protein